MGFGAEGVRERKVVEAMRDIFGESRRRRTAMIKRARVRVS
jgi:hypothetical protein